MCGRYSLGKKPRSWPADGEEFVPRFNIAPTQEAMVFVSGQSSRLERMRWGLVPHWAADEQAGLKMINARGETLRQKPAFRGCLETRRCAIPADSFYEWRNNGKAKEPVRFLMQDREPFFFAGLWDEWRKPDGGMLRSFTIVTTTPNDLVLPLHDRMPVILRPEQTGEWLSSDQSVCETLENWLSPFPAEAMTSYSVDRRLNNAKVDDEQCIEPVVERDPMLPGF